MRVEPRDFGRSASTTLPVWRAIGTLWPGLICIAIAYVFYLPIMFEPILRVINGEAPSAEMAAQVLKYSIIFLTLLIFGVWVNCRATQRQRLTFNLRHLFVLLTAFAFWLGYELDWIQRRHDALTTGHAEATDLDPLTRSVEVVAPPGLLGLFGERGHRVVYVETMNALGDSQADKFNED